MIKRILFFLFLILLALVLYLIFTAESFRKTDQPVQPVQNQSTVLPAADYQAKVKEIFVVYEQSARDNNLTTEKISELKDKLLALKGLPAKFKDLHVNLVLAMDRAQDYLQEKNQQARNTSQQIISQLKADYSWLNN